MSHQKTHWWYQYYISQCIHAARNFRRNFLRTYFLLGHNLFFKLGPLSLNLCSIILPFYLISLSPRSMKFQTALKILLSFDNWTLAKLVWFIPVGIESLFFSFCSSCGNEPELDSAARKGTKPPLSFFIFNTRATPRFDNQMETKRTATLLYFIFLR